MIVGVHKPAGDKSRDSDRTDRHAGKIRRVAQSENLVFSTRLNLRTLLMGATVVRAQHPQFSMLDEVDFGTYQMPRGGPVLISASEFAGEERVEEEGTAVDEI